MEITTDSTTTIKIVLTMTDNEARNLLRYLDAAELPLRHGFGHVGIEHYLILRLALSKEIGLLEK